MGADEPSAQVMGVVGSREWGGDTRWSETGGAGLVGLCRSSVSVERCFQRPRDDDLFSRVVRRMPMLLSDWT